jgi:hypothetical protein
MPISIRKLAWAMNNWLAASESPLARRLNFTHRQTPMSTFRTSPLRDISAQE